MLGMTKSEAHYADRKQYREEVNLGCKSTWLGSPS